MIISLANSPVYLQMENVLDETRGEKSYKLQATCLSFSWVLGVSI